MKRIVRNQFGATKTVKIGFSWTTLFFGAFVPLFRGDLKWFAIMFIANLFTCGIASIVLAFKYNELYMNDLLEKGYELV